MITFSLVQCSLRNSTFPPGIFFIALVFNALVWLNAEAQTVQFSSLSIKDGLSQATVTCMLQDRDGFMWLGTRDGLNRYDGTGFLTLRTVTDDTTSLSNNGITSLCQDMQGYIWVGTSFGLNRLDPRTFKVQSYFHWYDNPDALSSNRIAALASDAKGNLWIGTENGLNLLEQGASAFKKYTIEADNPGSLSNNQVTALHITQDGLLMVGTMGGMNVLQHPDSGFMRYRSEFDNELSLSDNEINCIAPGAEGRIWIGTRNGLNRFNPTIGEFERYYKDEPRKGLLPSSMIKAVYHSSPGNVYVGTPMGITRLSFADGNIYSDLLSFSGMAPYTRLHIRSLLIDNSGLVWLGTQSVGAVTLNLDAPNFTSVFFEDTNSEDPERNQIYGFTEVDTNCTFVATGRGLSRFDAGSMHAKDPFAKSKSELAALTEPIKSVVMDQNGLLWIGTDGAGLLVYDLASGNLRKYLVKPGLPAGISSNRITCLLAAPDGGMWLGTLGGGLCRYLPESDSFITYRFDGSNPESLRDNNITCLAYDREQALWIGTSNAGLYRLADGQKTLEHFESGDPARGNIGSALIHDIHLDASGRLWVATSGGGLALWRSELELFQSFGQNEGLANDVVLAVTCDAVGNIWLSTNGGISSFNPITQTFRNYFEDEVLSQNTFFPRSVFRDSKGRIYFGGANGFDYFNADGLSENSFVPRIVITGFQKLDENVMKSRLELARRISDTIVLRHDHPGFTLDFASLNFKLPEKNQYAYRLSGLFEQWRYIGTRRFATFTTLMPGEYTFEVIGSNNDGIWNYEPARVLIIVKPAFWQMWEFRLLAFLALIGLLYLLYRARLRGERRRRTLLKAAVAQRTREIARERDNNAVLLREVHHRVKNNLQIIVSLLNLQSRFIKDSALLEVFGEIQHRVRSMSLIHQKMYQSKDLSTVDIAEYITDLSNSLLSTYSLTPKVSLDVDVQVNRFDADTLTPLGLIINEVISNSLKYAFTDDRAGRIFVRLQRLPSGNLELIIGDNGVGLPVGFEFGASESFGTELIVALTEQLNGSIELLPDEGGTTYRIEFQESAH